LGTETTPTTQSMHIFMIVHNIDGEALRSSQVQMILSRLAATPRIHLIASVDNINAQLRMFDT
jgi:origin recognition complex subunit 2